MCSRCLRTVAAEIRRRNPIEMAVGLTRQLTIPTVVNTRGGGAGRRAISVTGGTAWSLNRDGTEFSRDDLSIAVALQPMLKAVEASAMDDESGSAIAVHWELTDGAPPGKSRSGAGWPESSATTDQKSAFNAPRLTPP